MLYMVECVCLEDEYGLLMKLSYQADTKVVRTVWFQVPTRGSGLHQNVQACSGIKRT
jgi:hypothetical protein